MTLYLNRKPLRFNELTDEIESNNPKEKLESFLQACNIYVSGSGIQVIASKEGEKVEIQPQRDSKIDCVIQDIAHRDLLFESSDPNKINVFYGEVRYIILYHHPISPEEN